MYFLKLHQVQIKDTEHGEAQKKWGNNEICEVMHNAEAVVGSVAGSGGQSTSTIEILLQ